jgi:hypothetical protein
MTRYLSSVLLNQYINEYLLTLLLLLLLLLLLFIVFIYAFKMALGTRPIDVNSTTLAEGTFSWQTPVKAIISSGSH